MIAALPFLSDAELAALCDGLEQPAAQLRYLKRLGLHVERKPSGRPLLMRSELERVLGAGRMMPGRLGTKLVSVPLSMYAVGPDADDTSAQCVRLPSVCSSAGQMASTAFVSGLVPVQNVDLVISSRA